jgi:hypothetical protein
VKICGLGACGSGEGPVVERGGGRCHKRGNET